MSFGGPGAESAFGMNGSVASAHQHVMPTPCSFSTTALVRILGTLLLAASAAGCDEEADQGIIGGAPEPRSLDVGDDLDEEIDEDFDPIADVYVSETRSSTPRRRPVDVECLAEDSPRVSYISTDPDECADLIVSCSRGWANVPDACGCGCYVVGHAAPVGVVANP